MEDKNKSEQEAIPQGQVLFDKWLLWFALTILISAVLYNAWGLYEVLSVPSW